MSRLFEVADNIAYGLRQRHVSQAEIRRRVDEALEMVRLKGAGKRERMDQVMLVRDV